MNIALLCGLYPKSMQDELNTNNKGRLDHAANTLQWAIFEGLTYLDATVTVFTLPFIESFPFGYKSLVIKDHKDTVDKKEIVNTVGFNNLAGYRLFSRYTRAKKKLFNWAKNTEGQKVILIYNIHTPFLRAATDAKIKYPEIRICLIVPDLPQYMSENKNFIYRFLKRIDASLIDNYLKKIDSFVVLTENMVDILKIKDKPWILIEGIFNTKDTVENQKKEAKKTILYTGKIDKRYGITTLMEAFSQIDNPNYQLWIRGDGNTKSQILKQIKTDQRIKYFNVLSRSEILKLQKRATVLVNPVLSKEDFTKFFFPSKTMEYLASGTPCIMHRLKGVPEEYFQYCYISDKEDAAGLKEMIISVCEKDQSELDEFGRKASKFIKENKNAGTQVRKIYAMLNSIQY